MVIVTDKNYYMDGYLKSNLDIANKTVKEDWDMFFIVDGVEGGGKSVLAQQMAYYNDNTLTMDRICFTPEEFRDTIKKAKKYEAVIYDEAITGLSARGTMSLINKTLTSQMAQIRQKNLFVYIVLPTFFDLDKYVALWRSRALIHVYTVDNFKRGQFTFYNYDNKLKLYVNGKKFYNYSNPKPNFRGRFTKGYVVDEEEYRKKKAAAEDVTDKKKIEEIDKKIFNKILFSRLQNPEIDITNEMKAKILEVSKPTFYSMLKDFKENDDI